MQENVTTPFKSPKFNIPSLNISDGGGSSKFNIPKLNFEEQNQTRKFNKLSDLVSNHLNQSFQKQDVDLSNTEVDSVTDSVKSLKIKILNRHTQ